MKKILSLILCVMLLVPALAMAEGEQVVNVYTWETYISDAVIADFEAGHSAEQHKDIAESDERGECDENERKVEFG